MGNAVQRCVRHRVRLAALLAGLYPAYRLSRRSAAEAMRFE